MNSANAVLVTVVVAFVVISVTMVFMHPDQQFDDPEKVVTLLTPAPPTYRKIFTEAIRQFEAKYAELMGTKRCLATTNGTNALLTALESLRIGAGDEVDANLVERFRSRCSPDVVEVARPCCQIVVESDEPQS